MFGFSSATSDMESALQVQPESPFFGGGGRKRKLVRHAFNGAFHEAPWIANSYAKKRFKTRSIQSNISECVT